MKKRLLAMLMVLMLVVGLLPVGALADGQIYEGNETFSYHITDSSLQAMVDKYNTSGSTSDVESVSITFDAPYLSGKSTFQFRNGYTIDFSNTSDAVQPNDIRHLTITLESGASLTVPGDALDWTWVSSLPRRYDLSLDAGDGNCTVTFYVQNGDSFDNSAWIVHQTIPVPVGSTLGNNMPALPIQEDPDAHWIAWEIGVNDGNGRELHADTVITGDMSVYARKTLPRSGGEQIRVMGPENDFIEILKEKLNVETIEINGISAFGGGEETNPYYDPSRVTENDPTENGWKDDGAYYRVMNTDQVPVPDDVPEHNDRVAPGELEGIKIYATVDGEDEVITLERNDLDVRVDQTVLRIYLREATEPETPVEPEIPGEPTTDPDVSGVGIVVDCTTDETHASETINIKGGTYTLHKAWDGDQWTCTVAITPDNYVDDYSIEGHTLNPANQTGTLLYIYDGSGWVYNGDGTPTVTFTVACSGTDPDPEKPRDPTDTELRELAVVLECVNEDVEHMGDPKTFNLRTTNCTYDIKQVNGQYICTVTPNYDLILERYNEQVAGGHTYADEVGSEKTFTLVWNDKAWDNGNASPITRQVKCDTPEPETQHVDVYAVKYRNYDTRVLIGSFMAPAGTKVIEFVEAQTLSEPKGFDKYEPADDGYYKDGLEYTFGENDKVSGWTNVYVNYIGKEQTVNVVIYRNGDTTTPYKTESIGPMRTGETLNIADLDINDYYQTQSGSIRFDFEGWYNDGGWNSYKDGNPDNTLGSSITINGYTNIICMVWDVERVNVQAVVDGKKDAAETIFTGEARRGTNLIDYLNAHTSEMTDYDRVGYIRDQWYNRDWYGHKFAADTTVNGWTNVYVTYTSDWQPVHVVIYKNGDTSKPVVDVAIYSLRKGETLDTTKLDISEYYTPDKFATGFEWEGWFNDGAWNNYKNAGCPADAAGLDEIYINGWTNVIAMVWDQFPVYYNIVDENGTVVEEKIYTDTITERDLEDYTFYNASRTGYTFDGWYQDEKDVGDASKLLTGLNKAKKWELYGRYDPIPYNLVIYAAIDKDKDNAVKIYSGMVDYGTPLVEYLESLTLETDVFPGYSPEDGKWYKYDSLAWTFGENDTVSGWTNVLINYVPNKYTIYYHGNGGMTGSGAVQSTSNFKYGSEATIKNNPFTYDGYVFEGWARSADGEVVYTGSEKVPFTEEEFPGLLENGKVNLYAVWAVDKLGGGEDGNEPDGVPDKYQATVKFVAGENGKVTGDVTKVYTIFGADGKYAEKGVITPSLKGVTVTPDEGYKVDGWTNAANERVDPESEITVEGGDVVVFTVNFQSDPSLKEITSFEKKLVTDRRTYHSFGLRVPTFIRNGSTVVVDEGKGVTLLYAISLTGTPGAEYAITDTGADVADGSALTGVIPETGVVTVYVTKDFTWREAAAAAYKDDALVNTAAVELTDNPNEPGQESTEEVDVVIDWDDPNVPVVPSDPDDDDDEDEDDEVFVPNWLNTEDHYAYIVGYEDGTIKPNNNITRAEVATIFFRLLTDNARARYWSQTNDYSDVAAGAWYNNAVSTLSNMGIINGYEDGTFKPNASITRAEFTAIATRFFDYEAEYDGAFNDVSARAWYADYVQAAVDMGLVDGYPDGGFHPNSNITRAEAVTIVNRVLNRAPHEDHLLSESVMNTWPDNVYGAWYYADMQEATNSHDYDWIRVSGERVEEWTEKLPERDWAALEQEWSSSHDA